MSRLTRFVTVFIDALDEGSTDDIRCLVGYLEHLTEHSMHACAGLRVCLASRHYPQITTRQGLSVVVEAQSEHDHDIDLYIRRKMIGEDSSGTHELRHRVRDRSAGVFLWVVLVVSSLNELFDQGQSLAVLFKKLDETPQDLYRMFGNVLSRDRGNFQECITLFRWFLFADRQLNPSELYIALQVSSSVYDWNADLPSRATVIRYLLNCSRGLVELTATKTPVVQFIHETVRDFLIGKHTFDTNAASEHEDSIVFSDFRKEDCHMIIARECLTYLTALGSQSLTARAERHVLTDYAARSWCRHILTSNQACSEELIALILDLLTNEGKRSTWLYYSEHTKEWHSKLFEGVAGPPLYYAVLTGVVDVVTTLLNQGVEVNAQGGYFGNALQAASEQGHEQTGQLLLEKGAEVNAHGGCHGNALHAASSCGHELVVWRLLEKGADVNNQGSCYGNPLQEASRSGLCQLVQMLLENGADVNAQGGYYGNALQAASYRGSEQIVQRLLERGANVNAQGGHFGNALQAASWTCSEQVVRRLLESGAEVNTPGGSFGTALVATSCSGSEQIVKTLLEKGAEVNAEGGYYGNVLQAALKADYEGVVQLLRKYGAST